MFFFVEGAFFVGYGSMGYDNNDEWSFWGTEDGLSVWVPDINWWSCLGYW